MVAYLRDASMHARLSVLKDRIKHGIKSLSEKSGSSESYP